MQHHVELNGSWRVTCLPTYHAIEGNGVRLFTPRRNQSRPVRRCATDPGAQQFLGWRQEWIDYLLGPDSYARRLDVRPEPWIGNTLSFGVARPRSREPIGFAWIDFESDAPEIGFVMRPDQRRNGLGFPAGLGLLALLHRHWGFPVSGYATAEDNAGASNTAAKSTFEVVHRGVEYELPNGRTCRSVVYRAGDPSAVSRCRWHPRNPTVDFDRFRSLDPGRFQNVDIFDNGPGGTDAT